MDNKSRCRTDEPSVGQEEAMLELEALLADERFRASDRNRRFLKYVMEKLFEGAEAQIKAYSIAIDVFGRAPDFDPILDPIVRIEATRLRASLSQYYDFYGKDHTLRIDLPKGGYVPVVSRLRRTSERNAQTNLTSTPNLRLIQLAPPPASLTPARVRFLKFAGIMCIACIVLACLLIAITPFFKKAVYSEKPTAALSVTVHGAKNFQARELTEELVIAFAKFQTVNLLRSDSGPYPPSTGETVMPQPTTYLIEVDYRPGVGQSALWWQVSKQANKEIIISQIDNAPYATGGTDELIGHLANEIAGREGAISRSELKHELTAPTLGHGCVLRAYQAIRTPTEQGLEATRICLERSLRTHPTNAEIYSALSMVLVAGSAFNNNLLTERVIKLSNTAARLAPNSAYSAHAQMEAFFYAGKLEAALAAGMRSISLNPYDIQIATRLSTLLTLTRQWTEFRPSLRLTEV